MNDNDDLPQSVDDEALDWIVRRDAGLELGSDAGFQAWLAASDEHQQAWQRANAFWLQLAEPISDPLMDAMRHRALEARPVPVQRRFAFDQRYAAAAAIVVAFVGGGLAWFGLHPDMPREAPSRVVAQHYSTGLGQTATVRLADGTQLTLDDGTDLDTRFSSGKREVRLNKGQVYVRVAHDASRPFALAALDRSITDVGTEFAVSTTADQVDVTLASGIVDVSGVGATVRLSPGQRFTAQAHEPGSVSSVKVASSLSWIDGYLTFDHATVADAIKQMNAYLPHPIVLTTKSIGRLPINGRYKKGDGEGFARDLASIYSLKLSHKKNGSIELRQSQ